MQPTDSSPISGMNTLVMGPHGTGKTTSLKTLLEIEGVEVFGIFTEPRYDILGAEFLSKIHYAYIPPASVGWSTLIRLAKDVNTQTNEMLQKANSVEGSKYTQFIRLLELCNDFVDQHGKHFGDVMTWGPDRVFFLDGLTGVSRMARGLKVGAKVALTQPDWGACQQVIFSFLEALTTNTRCHFILMAHVEREIDEANGGIKLMVRTMGRKLAPTIPDNFGDIILSSKVGDKFTWDTANPQADLKTGYTPIASNLPPSFAPLFREWKKRGGVLA